MTIVGCEAPGRARSAADDVPTRSAACGCYGCRYCVDVCLPDGSLVKGCANDLSKNTTVECIGAPEAGCDDWEERDDD